MTTRTDAAATPAAASPSFWRSVGWPLAAVLAISLLSAVWLRPLVALAFRDTPGARTVAELSLFFAAGMAPLTALGRSALLAGVVTAAATLIDERAGGFRTLLRIFIIAEIALCTSGLAAAAILMLRGPAAITSPESLTVPFGLDRLLSPADPMLLNLTRDITVFHLLWLVIVAAGMRSRGGLTREGSLVAILAACFTLVGIAAVRAAVIT